MNRGINSHIKSSGVITFISIFFLLVYTVFNAAIILPGLVHAKSCDYSCMTTEGETAEKLNPETKELYTVEFRVLHAQPSCLNSAKLFLQNTYYERKLFHTIVTPPPEYFLTATA